MYHFWRPCWVHLDSVVDYRNLLSHYERTGPTKRQCLHSSWFMPINDLVSFPEMMRGCIPVIIHILSVGCITLTCPSSEICIHHQISKILNITTIAIVIMEFPSTVRGTINQINGDVRFLPCHQHIRCEPCRCLGSSTKENTRFWHQVALPSMTQNLVSLHVYEVIP